MARKGLQYVVKRIRQIAISSIVLLAFIGLCFASLTQAEGKKDPAIDIQAIPADDVMRALMATEYIPCMEKTPSTETCKAFLNIDEDVLKNLLLNYPACMDGYRYFLDFSNQPMIKLSKVLKVYSRSKDKFTVRGLKLARGDSFPKGSPAIVVYGDSINMEDTKLEGFEKGVIHCNAR